MYTTRNEIPSRVFVLERKDKQVHSATEKRDPDFSMNLANGTYRYNSEKDIVCISREKYSENVVPVVGFADFLFRAWAMEYSVELRPDVLWYTIVNEAVSMILDAPDSYRHMYTTSQGRKELVIITGSPEEMPIDQLDNVLYNAVSDKEFMKLLTTTYDSAPENFDTVMKMVFAYSATPYYDYSTTRCGIQAVKMTGNAQDWKDLLTNVEQLAMYMTSVVYSEKSWMRKMNKTPAEYFNSLLETLRTLVGCINGDLQEEEARTFLEEMFFILENCGSGHLYNLRGWFKDFYRSYECNNLCDLPDHVAYVPWSDLDTKRMFYRATGITRSVPDKDGFMSVEYGDRTYEVMDQKLFETIKDGSVQRKVRRF